MLKKIIFWLFAVLFFLIPIILWPFTSEVFEFNKMVLVYILTLLILSVWIIRSIVERKIIFRRTILDLPILVFLGSQLISTFLSIDPVTSWLGYYSRFNGGLLSVIAYSLLYWAYVSNFDKNDTDSLIHFSILPGAAIVAGYGVLEHFGIDKNIWVQDVQSRVFSSLGQPNWLAAWLVALLPITWTYALTSKIQIEPAKHIKNSKFLIYFGLSVLFFWTLIFTKSRSGLLGFAFAFIIFWGLFFWQKKHEFKKHLTPFGIIAASVIAIMLISGTQFTPSVGSIITKSHMQQTPAETGTTALETGGTESGTIREIVWKGALDIWSHYPIFGTGVETFAYSYYKFRPASANLTSEWDFIYNKAHNEFLNTAADSGTVGLFAYLWFLGAAAFVIFKSESKINLALLAGFASLSVTNFFGFSVVPTQLQLFLFPAMAIGIGINLQKEDKKSVSNGQWLSILIVLAVLAYLLMLIGRYWYADTLYAKGKAYNGVSKPDVALSYLGRAISFEPYQALYYNELANSYVSIALAYNKAKDANNAKKYTDLAISQSSMAVSLSPANVNLKRSRFGVFIMLSGIDPNYLLNARDTLLDAIIYAPTDAKLYYNLGLTYARIGQPDQAISTLQKTIQLKSNYKEARLAYAYLLIDKKDFTEAKNQLNYILKNIDPNDSLTKQALESIK